MCRAVDGTAVCVCVCISALCSSVGYFIRFLPAHCLVCSLANATSQKAASRGRGRTSSESIRLLTRSKADRQFAFPNFIGFSVLLPLDFDWILSAGLSRKEDHHVYKHDEQRYMLT